MTVEHVCTVTIYGREYRFKNLPGQQHQLVSLAQRLDNELTEQAKSLPLATRDQLLVLSALNLLGEMSIQQQQTDTALSSLLEQIKKAE